jgi:hypothetical protein
MNDPLHDEAVGVIDSVPQLRAVLEAAAHDNAQLRRSLARLRAENEHLRAQLRPRPAHTDPRAHIRRMLSDPGSRNP